MDDAIRYWAAQIADADDLDNGFDRMRAEAIRQLGIQGWPDMVARLDAAVAELIALGDDDTWESLQQP